SPQSPVSVREPTAHCASCDPPCASDLAASSLTPKLLATRPSFVTRYRPPAPTHCTHPRPINPRNNRLKLSPPPPNRPHPHNPHPHPTALLRQPRYGNQRPNRKSPQPRRPHPPPVRFARCRATRCAPVSASAFLGRPRRRFSASIS